MTHIHGLDRGQLLLLPEAIDDYVATDNPVRFIDAFVEGLDLRVAGFERVEPKATGRPGYAPGDLLKGAFAIVTAQTEPFPHGLLELCAVGGLGCAVRQN